MPGKGRPIRFIKPEPALLRVLFYTALAEFLVSWVADMTINMWASTIAHPGLVEYRTNHVQYYVPYWVPAYFEASFLGFFVLLGSLFLLMSVVYRDRWVYLDEEVPGTHTEEDGTITTFREYKRPRDFRS